MKILVVDDSQIFRESLKKILAEFGYQDIQEAVDGQDALAKLIKGKVDLILLDWEMPNLSGLEVLKNIRSAEKTKEVPVIMCTSHSDKKSIVEAMRAGVNGYILKPFEKETIREKLKQLKNAEIAKAIQGA